ncbi:MAG: OmpA family protein [Bdellovibrionales bacterium]
MQVYLKFLITLFIFLFTQQSMANVVGSDVQNFNPTTNGLDFVTVQSSETLKPGVLNLGMFLNYAVNTLPYYDNSPQGRTQLNDSLLGADFNLGLGLTNNWDIGVSFPFVLNQTVKDNSGYHGEFSKTGNTEIRFNTKYRVMGDDAGGLAIIGSTNINRLIDNPYSGTDAGPTYNLELAADTTLHQIALGGNLGYRWRSSGRRVPGTFIEPLKNQFIASAAGSYLLNGMDTKLIAELFTSFPAEKSSGDQERSLSSAEMLVGAKHDLTHQLALHGGLGTELNHSTSSPDWRVYVGLNYAVGPLFQKSNEPHLVPLPTDNVKVEQFLSSNIYFEFDSDRMVGDYASTLEELADHLNKSPFKELHIDGHTDSIGSEEYNRYLSLKRAQAIRNYMIAKHKFTGKKITAHGFGESRPIANNGNFQGRQQNRRVEFKIFR